MRICVLNSSYEGSRSEFSKHDPYRDPSRYLPEHSFDQCLIEKATAKRRIEELAQRGYDVFVNLCDGAADEDLAGIEVVQSFERLGLAFTGAGSDFYEPTREALKKACHEAGVMTPAFRFARDRAEAVRAGESLRFPLIVKHPNSYASVGMTRGSRVETTEDLCARVEEMAGAFGRALIEEFIEGREFTVLAVEPRDGQEEPWVFAPMEFQFPPGETFKHFELKWIGYGEMTWIAVADTGLSGRLKRETQTLFSMLGGSGYARCDLRMNQEGELFMLDINPNCGVFYPPGAFGCADLILQQDPEGHRGFAQHLLTCALRRRSRSPLSY